MSYYNYHAKAKHLIATGHLVKMEIGQLPRLTTNVLEVGACKSSD